jgi:hypothetical protein
VAEPEPDDWHVKLGLSCEGTREGVLRVGSALASLGGEFAEANLTRQGTPMLPSWYWQGPPVADDLEEQVDRLLTELEATGDLLSELTSEEAVTLDLVASVWFRCDLFGTSESPSGIDIGSIPFVPLSLRAERLARLARLGVDFRVDLEVPSVGQVEAGTPPPSR